MDFRLHGREVYVHGTNTPGTLCDQRSLLASEPIDLDLPPQPPRYQPLSNGDISFCHGTHSAALANVSVLLCIDPKSNLHGAGCEGSLTSGTIPTELGAVTQLVSLQIYNTLVSGSLPTELGLLSRMTNAGFASELMHGTLPTQLGRWTALNYYFHFNLASAQGTVPTELGQLTGMQFRLQLGGLSSGKTGSPFSGTLPTQLALLREIGEISLDSSALSGTVPSGLYSLGKLRQFRLGYSPFLSGTLPSALSLTEGLRALKSSESRLSGYVPSQLGTHTALSNLLVQDALIWRCCHRRYSCCIWSPING